MLYRLWALDNTCTQRDESRGKRRGTPSILKLEETEKALRARRRTIRHHIDNLLENATTTQAEDDAVELHRYIQR